MSTTVSAQLDVTTSTIQSEHDQDFLVDMIRAPLDEHCHNIGCAEVTVQNLSGQTVDHPDPYAVHPVAYDLLANKHDVALSNSSIGTSLAPVYLALSEYNKSGQQYPFNGQFDP